MGNIIIFGSAERGIKCLKNTLPSFRRIFEAGSAKAADIYFTDNNEALWDTTIEEVPVIPPESLTKFNIDDTAIIIASARRTEIYSQISVYGFTLLFYLDGNDSILPLDLKRIKLDIWSWHRNLQTRSMGEYAFFESYKFLGQEKYNNNTLFDEPFFGYERHLVEFKDAHKGERCFILGNGPSLNLIDINRIKNEITFGSNRVYKAFPQWGFSTKYWGMSDTLCFSQVADEAMQAIPDEVAKFIPVTMMYSYDLEKYKNVIPCNLINTHPLPHTVKFSSNPFGIYEGFTVTYLLIQLATIMGCNPIYLIGVDHNYNYAPRVSSNTDSFFDKNSSNYFIPNYSSDDYLLNAVRLDISTPAYALAFRELSKMGREIYNASPGTKLEVIPKIEFESIFK